MSSRFFVVMVSVLVVALLIVGYTVSLETEPPKPAEAPFERRPVTPESGTYEWSEALSTTSFQPNLIEAADEEHVWVTGYPDGGTIYFYDGSMWTMQFSTVSWLNCISAASSDAAWASGNNAKAGEGLIYYFDGSAWSEQFRTSGSISEICAVDPSCAWALGDGSLFRFDGAGWSPCPGPPSRVDVIAASGNDMVWACGDGVCWLYDGSSWTEQLRLEEDVEENQIEDVCAIGSGRAWLVASGRTRMSEGSDGYYSRIYHFDGSTWQVQYETENPISRISASARNDAWAWLIAESHGPLTLLHFDGKEWGDYGPPDVANVTCVSPLGKGRAWLTGGFG